MFEDKVFEKFVERRPRCKAAMLTLDNAWDVSLYLNNMGYEVQMRWVKGNLFVEVQRGEVHFTADVGNGDAIMLNGYEDVEYIPGQEFRRQWEREPE